MIKRTNYFRLLNVGSQKRTQQQQCFDGEYILHVHRVVGQVQFFTQRSRQDKPLFFVWPLVAIAINILLRLVG